MIERFLVFVGFIVVVVSGAFLGGSTYFDVMPETCKHDNWGLPKQTSKTYNPNYDKVLRIPCQEQWAETTKPFSLAHDMATAIH